MGKLIEGLWDCPFCDNKRIKAGQKTCPLCGHPQDENTKFYMPDAIEYVSEEKAAKISRNPDWQCSFCGSLNNISAGMQNAVDEITDEKSSSLSGNLCCHHFRNDVLSGTESKKCNH